MKVQVKTHLLDHQKEGQLETVDLHSLSAKEARAAVLCVLANIQVHLSLCLSEGPCRHQCVVVYIVERMPLIKSPVGSNRETFNYTILSTHCSLHYSRTGRGISVVMSH